MRQQEHDFRLIETVNAHLGQLAVHCVYKVDQANLRVASASLRALLVEEMLSRAWKVAGFKGPMTFKTWRIAEIGPDAVAYCGGGDLLPGIPFSVCHNARLSPCSLDLAALQRQTRIQVGNDEVSTVEIIKYVANTQGGAHFDAAGASLKSRRGAFELLSKLESGAIPGPPLRVNDRNLLHHELLSLVQAILGSPEVERLRTFRAPKPIAPR